MTWVDVGKAEDPVRGSIPAFENGVDLWKTAFARAIDIKREFKGIADGNTTVGLEGEAAKALESIVKEVQSVLDDVPQVFVMMASTLNDHLVKLRQYRAAADQALAKATAAKEARRVASSQAAAANTRATSLKRQIEQLKAQPPELSAGQLVTVQRQLTSELSTQQARAKEAATAQATIEAALKQWETLRADEDELNKTTARQLEHFDLLSLRDPGFLEQKWNEFEKFWKDLATDLSKFVASASRGDWEQALWHLRSAIDKISTVIEVIVGVLVVVALVAAVVFGTAISFGALVPALLLVGLVLASAKFSITSHLIANDSVNKETGEKLGASDLAFDALDVGLAAASFLTAGVAKSAFVGRVPFAKYNVGRAFLKDQAGVVFKRGYEISFKKTAVATGKIILKGRLGLDGILNDSGIRDGLRNLGPDGNVWSGTAPNDSPQGSIYRDLDLLRSNRRGLTTPVQTVLLPTY